MSSRFLASDKNTTVIKEEMLGVQNTLRRQEEAIAANTNKTGITGNQSAKVDYLTVNSVTDLETMKIQVTANNAKTGITLAQSNDITSNNAKTGITSAQSNDITSNNAKTGITSAQANVIDYAVQYGADPSGTVIVGGGVGYLGQSFKIQGSGLVNTPGATVKYATVKLPDSLNSDITITLPDESCALTKIGTASTDAMPGDTTTITTGQASNITTNGTNIATNGTNIATKLNRTFSPYEGGMLLQTDSTGQIIESGMVYNDTIVSLGSHGSSITNIENKLNGIESGAQLTNAARVQAAGALMDSEMTDLAGVKAMTVSDYALNSSVASAYLSIITDYSLTLTGGGNFDGAATHILATNALPASSVLNEDNFASNSNTLPPSQDSVRTYVDARFVSNLNEITSNNTELARLNRHYGTTGSDRWVVKSNKIGCVGTNGTMANNTTIINESNFFLDTSPGSLPGQPSYTQYPTLKTNYITLYFSVSNKYTAYLQQIGTTPFVINFTGQHQALPLDEDLYNNVDDYVGKIVISNGDLSSFINDNGEAGISSGKRGIHINEAMPRVVLCNTYKDKRVFGVISNEEEDNETANMATRATEKHFRQGAFVSVISGLPADDNRLFINALGEGAIWVINSHGNIENGDYICSSDKGKGYGCLQDDDLLHNYTCAKATIDCSFDLASEEYECKEITISGENLRIAFIACVYCF